MTDRSHVRLWVNGGGPIDVWEECDDSGEWTMRRFDLTPFYASGDDLQIEFTDPGTCSGQALARRGP